MQMNHLILFSKNIATILMSTLLGGWDNALEILLIVMTLDYITGLASAFKKKVISSSIGYNGLVKKASIFIIVILAAQMDRMVSDGSHLFRNGTAFFFSANDAISILENIGQIGIKIPSFFHKSLIDFYDKYVFSFHILPQKQKRGKFSSFIIPYLFMLTLNTPSNAAH